ncbi:MAG TPA: hypothetical protein VGS62_01320, partial [Streptosporangiaceae bacterium]|nr:hypothetical protein [Streptosporangiaceae bacterium]
HRQLGDLTAAQTCFDGAVNTLLEMLGTSSEPVILRSLGDSHVLQAQCRLDQAVSNHSPELIRGASLRIASEALDKATSYFARHREATGGGIHYEGRMHGAKAFLGVAISLVQPGSMTPRRWSEIETLARGAFEPERDRKPFGIVAGKFALSVVLLAKARWQIIAPVGGGEAAAQVALEQADTLLRSIFIDYLEPGYVQLGARFEMPKVRLASSTVENLRALPRLGSDAWDEADSLPVIWSPLA